MSHILYVDDDEALCFLMTRVMQEAGHQVTTHQSGSAALHELTQHPDRFDLVISDMNMPGMSGLEFARIALAQQPQLPVVIVTGCIDREEQQQAMAIGVRKLLLKPNGIQELVRELAGLL